MTSLDSFKCRKTLKVGGKTYVYYSLPAAEKNGLKGISKLPYSMKVLLENLLRNEDGRTVKKDDIVAVVEVAEEAQARARNRLPPGARADAGFHRRAGGGRSRRDAQRDAGARRRCREDQSAGAGRSRHRPFGDRQLLRRQQGVRQERRRGIQAEPGALRIPEVGPEGVLELLAWCRPAPASATRSISNISRRRSGPRRRR